MNYLKKLCIFIFLLMIELFLVIFVLYIKGPIFSIKDKETIEINYKRDYKIKNIKVSYLGKNISNEVIIDSNIDTNKIGNYRIIYSIFIDKKEYKRIKYINVVDNKVPDIILEKEKESYACPDKEYIENGYDVKDNLDNNLKDIVKVIKDKDKWTYLVIDSSGNLSMKDRKIMYKDIEPPQIILDKENINTYIGKKYEDKGYKAIDNCDEIPSDQIKVTGNVDVNKIGKYTLTYEVKDKAGNIANATRIVNVVNEPVFRSKTIYLTFDDGPSSNVTPVILNILKEENVKATFFVNYTGLDNLIRREHNEGHAIGNHTASHNFGYIYSSTSNYWTDFSKLNNYLYNINGSVTNLIRFPGGSSNTISRNYSSKIMTNLVNDANNKG
ncbi:MAG TPA: DUF5011 domain-containing protein, partial [Bacilli bacterium]|nr:DUF5011 domain-containing protein [Bacilli bacterium]